MLPLMQTSLIAWEVKVGDKASRCSESFNDVLQTVYSVSTLSTLYRVNEDEFCRCVNDCENVRFTRSGFDEWA
jgi:hypothetical protein